MKRIIIYLLFLLSVGINQLQAQEDKVLKQLLQNKNNLTEIMKVVDNYYKNPATINRVGISGAKQKYKQWKRWEWFVSSRLGSDGEFVNISKRVAAETEKRDRAVAKQNQENVVNSTVGSWSSIGPTSTTVGLGRADRIAFHPTDPDIVFAGTSGGGLWKTINGGTSWSNLTANITSTGISGISIHPNNPDIIHILTGDGDSGGDFSGLVDGFGYTRYSIGVLETNDGGITWKKTSYFTDTFDFVTGFQLQRDPANANILLAATDKGLFRTNNGGNTWTKVMEDKCVDVIFKPTGTTCYAIDRLFSGARFWVSTNAGIDWDLATGLGGIGNAERAKLAVTPQNPNIVYILCGRATDDGKFAGILRSTQSGNNYVIQSTTPNIMGKEEDGSDDYDHSKYNLSMAVKPTTISTIITGAVKIWRNGNNGLTGFWRFLGGTHADIHDLQYNPLDNKLWAATDGGMYYSTNDGDDWTVAFNGMPVSQVYRMEVRPSDYLQILAGLQDNGIKFKSTGSFTYDHILNADGFSVGFDSGFDSIFYARINDDLFRFTDNGNDKNSILPASKQMDDFFSSMAVHTSLGNSLFAASDSFWRTTNGGSSWNVSPDIDGGWFLRTCPSNGSRIYVAGGENYRSGSGILRRSDNGGLTWPPGNILSDSDNVDFPVDYPKITSINVNPTNSANVWITFGGFDAGLKVYYSSDAGANWDNRSGTLPNIPVNCIALDNSNNAYVGTDNGVYYRGTGMSDWVPFYNNLPYVPVTDLIISQAENRIRAATFGRGIWSSELYSNCPVNLPVGGILEGQEFHEASNSVTSTATLQVSEGTKVQMRGGREVNLLPGFTAQETTSFRALIGPCGSGGVAGFRIISDSTTLLPNLFIKPSGKIKAMVYVKPGNIKLETTVTVIDEGEIEFILTDANGAALQRWDKQTYAKGIVEKQLPVSSDKIKTGINYLHIIHNGVWQHMQEWEVK